MVSLPQRELTSVVAISPIPMFNTREHNTCHLVVDNRVVLRVVVEAQTKYLSNKSLDQLCTTLL